MKTQALVVVVVVVEVSVISFGGGGGVFRLKSKGYRSDRIVNILIKYNLRQPWRFELGFRLRQAVLNLLIDILTLILAQSTCFTFYCDTVAPFLTI